MRIIGTLSSRISPQGFRMFNLFNFYVPVSGLSEEHVGKHLCIHGIPKWDPDKGSYYDVFKIKETMQHDCNDVVVDGTVTAIFQETINARNRRSVCLLIQQGESEDTTVLVTALSSNIDKLNPSSLSVGEHIRVSGYIAYHGKGLHVLYATTARKGVTSNDQLVS